MFYGGTTGDKPMIALAALRPFQIADAVFKLLLPVTELLQLLFAPLLLDAELFDFGIWYKGDTSCSVK